MSLKLAQNRLNWPSRSQVVSPRGAGPRALVHLAQKKLNNTIGRLPGVKDVKVGLLTRSPESASTEAPLAIVCEFGSPLPEATLQEVHKLAWNFGIAPLLLTIEPTQIRAWTCCEPPCQDLSSEIREYRYEYDRESISSQAVHALNWINLVSGRLFTDSRKRFNRKGQADQLLLRNLQCLRSKLVEMNLDDDTAHDLIARIIFIQFLFQRKDQRGLSALSPRVLARMSQDGILSKSHTDLGSILRHYGDTYSLFKELNRIFNGDLFALDAKAEQSRVKAKHLMLLAEFVSGTLDMGSGQMNLWKLYSFDVIPLELISSIYEIFVGNNPENVGVVYTPSHVVDMVLDTVLPWNGTHWDQKVLDPACGSGIFLVKAYERLIHRWKNAHKQETVISIPVLRRLLENNLFGMDIDPHAVRVACFSLYLAMCDEIDPRHYWTRVRFPCLRGIRLVSKDFFEHSIKEETDGPRLPESFDVIIGNPPWGRSTMTSSAKQWGIENGWSTAYHDIGPLFLPKCVALLSESGHLAMLQPALALLFNQVGPAREFRQKFFTQYKIEQIINLAGLRFSLFKDAIPPTCIITMQGNPPDGLPVTYVVPKAHNVGEADYRIVVEPQDIHLLDSHSEVMNDPYIWTSLMWGTRRDHQFVRRLSHLPTLQKMADEGIVKTREGIYRADKKKREDWILGRPLLKWIEGSDFPFLNVDRLLINDDPLVHSRDSTNFEAFALPQMILKKSWVSGSGRFQAVMVDDTVTQEPVICTKSFVTVHFDESACDSMTSAYLSYNSIIAVYFLLLTSGRFANYRPEVIVKDLLKVPIASVPTSVDLRSVPRDHHDQIALEAFDLNDLEKILVHDLIDYTLPDFKGNQASSGRQPTRRGSDDPTEEYCSIFMRVLQAAFGTDKYLGATVFQEPTSACLPVRLVAIHLDCKELKGVRRESIESTDLMSRLKKIDEVFRSQSKNSNDSIFFQRVIIVYDKVTNKGSKVPTVYIIKPDVVRHWTRSMAIRDADQVAADIMLG